MFEAVSPTSGRVRVVESRGIRSLVVAGQTLSAYPASGDWSEIRREYWWRAFEGLRLPRRARVLVVGLGGGTQVHALRALAAPRAVLAIERDPLIVGVARRWFGLREAGPLEIVRGEAEEVARRLASKRRRFELVVEDATYAQPTEQPSALHRALFRLVAPGGILVVNRHFRRDAARLAAEMGRRFRDVSQRRIRRDGENVVVRGVGRRLRAARRLRPEASTRLRGRPIARKR